MDFERLIRKLNNTDEVDGAIVVIREICDILRKMDEITREKYSGEFYTVFNLFSRFPFEKREYCLAVCEYCSFVNLGALKQNLSKIWGYIHDLVIHVMKTYPNES